MDHDPITLVREACQAYDNEYGVQSEKALDYMLEIRGDAGRAIASMDHIAHNMRHYPDVSRDLAVLGDQLLQHQTVVVQVLRTMNPIFKLVDKYGVLFVFSLMKNLKDANNALEIQKQDGNWDYDPYMHGMLNGMEFILATIEGREMKGFDAPTKWRTKDLTEFVEGLAKNGTGFETKPSMRTRWIEEAGYYHRDGVTAYIQRIDESVRERALEALTYEPREEITIIDVIGEDGVAAARAHIEATTDGALPAEWIDLGDGTSVHLDGIGMSFAQGSEIVTLSHSEIHVLLEKVFNFLPDETPTDDVLGAQTYQRELIITPIADDATDAEIDAAIKEHREKMTAAEITDRFDAPQHDELQ
jgi:hypothetical protein